MTLTDFIDQMPKAELHVHLEGSIRPETLLTLARRHDIALPATSVEGIRDWYRFTDFPHFVEIYMQISECLRTPDDIELIAREFLTGQAAQNIRYSEVTYTPYTHYWQKHTPFADQLAALSSARRWGEETLGARMNLVLDIPRQMPTEAGDLTVEWALGAQGDGVVALGLGGYEVGYPPQLFAAAFARATEAGLPCVPHAGETEGPASIWSALGTANAVRIGHGVRCLEDPALVAELRDRQIPLEVCPTSNVCLGVVPDIAAHPLPRLIEEGLIITIGSDDPPLFNTTLTAEYHTIAKTFGYGTRDIEHLVMNGVNASLLGEEEKAELATAVQAEFAAMAP
ncbi:MAG: adenosine deaminase [Anaerolineae bacterium]|nr:adenosine deaminase [Anaerolineae bacterium]